MRRMVPVLLAVMVPVLFFGCGRETSPAPAAIAGPSAGPTLPMGAFQPPSGTLCPPEEIATLMDNVIGGAAGPVSLTRVEHAEPGKVSAGDRWVWVFAAKGKPVSFVCGPLGEARKDTPGMTARALKRARQYVAEYFERGGLGTEYHLALARLLAPDSTGKPPAVTQQQLDDLVSRFRKNLDTPSDWKVDEAWMTPDHQSVIYGVHITEITLLDKETESWAVTVRRIGIASGGEIWLRFDKNSGVSAEFGK